MSYDLFETLLLSICLLDSRAASICIKVYRLTVSGLVLLRAAEPFSESRHYTVYVDTA